MTLYFNAKPPKLMFTNNGVRSPDDFILDEFGLPDFNDDDLQTDHDRNLYRENDPDRNISQAWIDNKEKHFLYGTTVEEVLLWMETIYDRHGFTSAINGDLEAWLLPSMELLPTDPQEGGHQLDGYHFSNPEWWHHFLNNMYTVRGFGALTTEEKTFIREFIVHKHFPITRDDTNPYSDVHFTNNTNQYFGSGKAYEGFLSAWLFPFELVDEIGLFNVSYRVSSNDAAGIETGQFDDLNDKDYVSNLWGDVYLQAYHTHNTTGYPYYEYVITLLNVPYDDLRLDEDIADTPTNPKTPTIRNVSGFYGDGKNGALAFNITTELIDVYVGSPGTMNSGVDGFRLGVWWSDNFPDSGGTTEFTFDDVENQTTWFHDLTVGLNVVELPDSILDFVPQENQKPYFVFAPPNEEVPAENFIYKILIEWGDVEDLTVANTGYAHCYPITGRQELGQGDPPEIMRFCTDDYLMQINNNA